jgi:NADH-quinone oxidoreductase subunit G
MEFLLINHPLDCPICDQGGECDLQDQAYHYGCGSSRYDEHKRAVEDKNMGPLIKTTMTRCIHCTRCVRFAEDIAGVPEIGALYRGEDTQITTYLEKAATSEMSGNVIDLCPVGALTSKPYAYAARPWELKKTETIDVMDAVGSAIRVDSRGEAVLRVMPRLNEAVNEEWISDKTRFACDGLSNQRLDRPYVRRDGKLQPASWDEAFAAIKERLAETSPERVGALVGNLADMEATFALKQLMGQFGTPNMDCRQDGAKIDASDRASYLLNTGLANLEKADVVLLVGVDPRKEAPGVNTRLRRAYIKNGTQFFSIGQELDLTYPVTDLGNEPSLLNTIMNGEHDVFKALKDAKNPVIMLGNAALAREDGNSILNACKVIADNCNVVREDWNGFNMLHYAAGRVGALELGFVPGKGGKDIAGMIAGIATNEMDTFFLLGVDEIDMSYFGEAFIVYQGHHGDIGAHRADVILPGAAYTEKNALYMNMEGRLQEAQQAVFPPGEAREDWRIIRALSEALGEALPFDTLDELREAMAQTLSGVVLDEPVQAEWKQVDKPSKTYRIRKEGFESAILNFYMTDPISRSSKTMAECVNHILKQGKVTAEAA